MARILTLISVSSHCSLAHVELGKEAVIATWNQVPWTSIGRKKTTTGYMKEKNINTDKKLCDFNNGCNTLVNELLVVQFWSEIIFVISNQTRVARSFDFEITRMISDQIALHSEHFLQRMQLKLRLQNPVVLL